MSKSPKAALPREVSDLERIGSLVAATVSSSSDPERVYSVRLIMEVDCLCPCGQCGYRHKVCPHMKDIVRSMDAKELKAWIIDSMVVGDEVQG